MSNPLIIIWWYLNRYYSLIFIRCYYLVSPNINFYSFCCFDFSKTKNVLPCIKWIPTLIHSSLYHFLNLTNLKYLGEWKAVKIAFIFLKIIFCLSFLQNKLLQVSHQGVENWLILSLSSIKYIFKDLSVQLWLWNWKVQLEIYWDTKWILYKRDFKWKNNGCNLTLKLIWNWEISNKSGEKN